MGGVVVEDGVDDLAGWHLALDGIKETDELLMRVSLHAAAEDDAVEDIEGGKQGGRAVPLVVVGHGAALAGLERQTGLGSIERLNLAHMGICESRFSVQDVIDKSPVVTSYPRSEPVCMTRPVCEAASNSHPVAAIVGCTNIPLASGKGSEGRDHSFLRLF